MGLTPASGLCYNARLLMMIAGFVLLLHLGGGLAALVPAVSGWRYRPALQAAIALLAALLWLPVSSRLPLMLTTMGGAPGLLPEVVWRIDQTGWFLSGFLLLATASALLVALFRDAPPASGLLLLLAGVGLTLVWAASPVALIMAGMLLALALGVALIRLPVMAQSQSSRSEGSERTATFARSRYGLAPGSRWLPPLKAGWSAARAGLGALAGAAALLEGERGLILLLALAAALWLVQ